MIHYLLKGIPKSHSSNRIEAEKCDGILTIYHFVYVLMLLILFIPYEQIVSKVKSSLIQKRNPPFIFYNSLPFFCHVLCRQACPQEM